MELNIFMKELETALVRRGIPGETAQKHVSNLRRTFTTDDLSEIDAIQSNDEIEQLADSISVILSKNKRPVSQSTPTAEKTEESLPAKRPAAPQTHHTAPKTERHPVTPPDDFSFEPEDEKPATSRGKLIFWVGLILTLPLSIGLLSGIAGAFAGLFIALIALIVGCVAGLVAFVAAGAGVSLVGIIFGITQLFSFVAAGIYEIGLGVMIAGTVLFVSVLVYNFAVRLLPWLISLLGIFMGFVFRKLKELFCYVRRECYKL